MTEPLKLTLYDPETQEIKNVFSRAFIPTGIFTELMRMTKTLKSFDIDHPEKIDPDELEVLYALVAEIFGNKISIEEIKTGTDLIEFMAFIMNIIARVEGNLPTGPGNPTLPGQMPRKRNRRK